MFKFQCWVLIPRAVHGSDQTPIDSLNPTVDLGLKISMDATPRFSVWIGCRCVRTQMMIHKYVTKHTLGMPIDCLTITVKQYSRVYEGRTAWLQTHLEELRVLDWPDHHLLDELLGMVLIHRTSVKIRSTACV